MQNKWNSHTFQIWMQSCTTFWKTVWKDKFYLWSRIQLSKKLGNHAIGGRSIYRKYKMSDTKDYTLYDPICVKFSKRQNSSERKQVSGWPVAGLMGGKGTRENLGGWKPSVSPSCSDYRAIYICWNSLKWIDFMVYKLYHNKTDFASSRHSEWAQHSSSPSSGWHLISPYKPWAVCLCMCPASSWLGTSGVPPPQTFEAPFSL